MSDERIDLSSLDLDQDQEKFERLVGNIMWRARGELARRGRRQAGALEVMATWFRPAIAAAAAIAGISLTMMFAGPQHSSEEFPTGAYMSGTEVPTAMSSWYEDGNLPTADDMLLASEGGK